MPVGAYIVTCTICAVMALFALVAGNNGLALFFGIGIMTNWILYTRRLDRDELDQLRWERDHPKS